ncbi:YbaB/EbfC family nucleoid-associated protein, partial [Amylibacter sp.]|nr:YbaB/EbfC family nucleoid-associated protein [Amylibacter sp.]
DGKDKADIKAKAEMGKITEGLNLPAGMKLPF